MMVGLQGDDRAAEARWAMATLVWTAVVLAALVIALAQWVEVRLRYRDAGPDPGLEVTIAGFGGRAVYHASHGARGRSGRPRPEGRRLPSLGRLDEFIEKTRAAVDEYQLAGRYLARRAVGVRIEVALAVGTGEAASTGLAAGVAWAALGNLAAHLAFSLPPGSSDPVVRVIPDFRHRIFEASLDCIFRIRAGHIIGAVVRLLQGNRRRRTARG